MFTWCGSNPYIQTDHSCSFTILRLPSLHQIYAHILYHIYIVFSLHLAHCTQYANHCATLLLTGPIIDKLPGRVETPRMTQSLEKLSLAPEEGRYEVANLTELRCYPFVFWGDVSLVPSLGTKISPIYRTTTSNIIRSATKILTKHCMIIVGRTWTKCSAHPIACLAANHKWMPTHD